MSKHELLGPTTLLASGRIGREVAVNRSDRPVFVDSDGHICCEHGERAATIQSWINAERETPDTAVCRPSVCDCANLDGLLTTYDVPNENLPVHGGSLFKLCGSLGTAEITANTRPQRFVLTTHEGHELWVQPSGMIVSGTDRRFPALCKKCRQTPILTLLVFLHTPRGGTARGGTLPRAGAQRPCCGGVEDGSTDAERPKKAGTGRVPRERAPTPLWI